MMNVAKGFALPGNKESLTLVISVFIAGLCSIIYELLIGTASSYFLGDSVKQFSLTIGFYMAAMGLGSYLSRFFQEKLLEKFIGVEILLGFLGGISVPALYLAFAYTDQFSLFKTFFIVAIGVLIGLEIPLLTRLMDRYYALKFNISNILSLDYFGALIATLIFPFFLLPFIGTFKSSLVFGLINMVIGFINLWAFKEEMNLGKKKYFLFLSLTVTLFLGGTLFASEVLLKNWHNRAYEDRVVFAKQSEYQSIVLTKHKKDVRMFLNGGLQFSSIDEYRYHEPLVHIPMSLGREIKNVLVLGGGDGLGVRELLKHHSIERVVLVDLDPAVVAAAKTNPYLTKLNKNSFESPKVEVVNQDAFVYLKKSKEPFDLIISDLPDPNNISLARLYSVEFYLLLKQSLAEDGVFVTQATSPFFAKSSFWCIARTIERSGLDQVYPFHVNVPSFGEWGFVMASRKKIDLAKLKIQVKTRFLSDQVAARAFIFEKDLLDDKKTYSSLESPKVLTYYLSEWKYWN